MNTYTRQQIVQAAQEALDNWDFEEFPWARQPLRDILDGLDDLGEPERSAEQYRTLDGYGTDIHRFIDSYIRVEGPRADVTRLDLADKITLTTISTPQGWYWCVRGVEHESDDMGPFEDEDEAISDGLEEAAYNRVQNSDLLRAHEDYIMADWHEGGEHWLWVSTATESEIAEWVEAGS